MRVNQLVNDITVVKGWRTGSTDARKSCATWAFVRMRESVSDWDD